MLPGFKMWTYQKARHQGKRQELWVWPAVVAETDGRRWADFEVGSRGAETFLRWYARLPEAKLYCSDGLRVHREWLGLHSEYRTRLNWLGRRTKGYTKSRDLLECSLVLILEC